MYNCIDLSLIIHVDSQYKQQYALCTVTFLISNIEVCNKTSEADYINGYLLS